MLHLDGAFERIGVDGDGCLGIRVGDAKVLALPLVERMQVQLEGTRGLIALEFAAPQFAFGAAAREVGGGDRIRERLVQLHGHIQRRPQVAVSYMDRRFVSLRSLNDRGPRVVSLRWLNDRDGRSLSEERQRRDETPAPAGS